MVTTENWYQFSAEGHFLREDEICARGGSDGNLNLHWTLIWKDPQSGRVWNLHAWKLARGEICGGVKSGAG